MIGPGARSHDPLSPQAAQALRSAYLDLLCMASCMMEDKIPGAQAPRWRSLAVASLQRHEDQLRSAGVPKAVVEDAQFPVMCLLDEAAKRHLPFGSKWEDLQLAEAGMLTGGEEVFRRLDRIYANPRSQIEVLEIYVRCIFLGFQGMYAPDKLKELLIRTRDLNNELRERLGPLPDLSPDIGLPAESLPLRPVLTWPFIVAMAMVLLSLCAIGLALHLSYKSHSISQEIYPREKKAKDRDVHGGDTP